MITYPLANTAIQWFGKRWPTPAATPEVVVLHTTESSGWPHYGGGAKAPHLTVAPDMRHHRLVWRQHFDMARSARALRHAPGTVETNNRGAIQVEMVGTCRLRGPGLWWSTAPGWALEGIAEFLAWCNRQLGIPLVAAKGWPPYRDGASSPERMTGGQWLAFRGICGHLHVPGGNTHLDPADFPIARVLDMITREEDEGMAVSRDDANRIAAAVWGASFGEGRDEDPDPDNRITAGQRLANAATKKELADLEARLEAAIRQGR